MKKKYNAFSLMEMMVVLLIVAIVAAASAPMINKKVTSMQGEGDCLWTEANAGISYNAGGLNNVAVMIGASDRNVTNTSLHIASDNTSFITFTDRNNRTPASLKISPELESIGIGSPDGTFGDNSVVLGYDTEADQSGTAVGYNAKAGTGCTAIGAQANASGDSNVAIGAATIANAGSGRIAIGFNTRVNHNDSVAIGTEIQTTANHQIVLGGPEDTVWIPGNLRVDGIVELGVRSANVKYRFGNLHRLGTPSDIPIVNAGQVPTILMSQSNGELESDRRLKNVGEKLTSGLEDIKKLELYNYTYKKDEAKTPHVGVMAQDLMKIFPNAVHKGEDGYYRIRMEDMFYSAINAIKELDLKITEIKDQIKAFVDRVTNVEKTVNELKTTVETQQKAIDAQQKTIETQQKTIEAQQKAIDDLAKKVEKISKKKAVEEAKTEVKTEE